MAAANALAAAGAIIIIWLIPWTTLCSGTVLAMNPIAPNPRAIIWALKKSPTLIGRVSKAIVNPRMLLPVFHSP